MELYRIPDKFVQTNFHSPSTINYQKSSILRFIHHLWSLTEENDSKDSFSLTEQKISTRLSSEPVRSVETRQVPRSSFHPFPPRGQLISQSFKWFRRCLGIHGRLCNPTCTSVALDNTRPFSFTGHANRVRLVEGREERTLAARRTGTSSSTCGGEKRRRVVGGQSSEKHRPLRVLQRRFARRVKERSLNAGN